MRPAWWIAPVAAVLALWPRPLSAQGTPGIVAMGTGLHLRTQTLTGSGRLNTQRPALAGAARLSVGRWFVHGTYLQGSSLAGPGAETVVEAHAEAGFHVVPWLAVKSGARARAYAQPTGTRRLMLWEVGARMGGWIGGRWAHGVTDLWVSPLGGSNLREKVHGGRGGEAAVAVRVPRIPLWLRCSYRIDVVRVGPVNQREVVEGLGIGVAVGNVVP